IHRAERCRRRVRARQHRAARRRDARRSERYLPDQADGQCDGALAGQHLVRRLEGRVHARRRGGLGSSGAFRRSRGRRDPARVRPPRDRGAGVRAGGGPGAAHPARAGRRARRAWHRRRLRDPPGGRADAWAHERAARRGAGALRPAQGDGRHQRRVQADRRGAGRRRQRRGEPGREVDARRTDLRHAHPERRRGAADRLHEAVHAPRLRRHRERAALRPEDDAALRRRQGLLEQAAQCREGAV
ncbi:MAG: NAD(P) transhydrogenase subunit beta, partial [uncultured Nocardioidaceae bacterium]